MWGGKGDQVTSLSIVFLLNFVEFIGGSAELAVLSVQFHCLCAGALPSRCTAKGLVTDEVFIEVCFYFLSKAIVMVLAHANNSQSFYACSADF